MIEGICYIVGAGDFFGEIQKKDGDMLIAADGGYEKIKELGLVPDVLIGDFDSLSELPDNIKTIRHPVQKDETDMFLAYKMGAEIGYDRFALYGGVGGREDHTFANYCLLLKAKNENKHAVLFGNRTKVYIIKNEKIELFGDEGKTISVFPFGKDAEGVYIKGLKYEAENITLCSDFPLGVSNSFTKNKACISVEKGALLIIEEY